MPEGRVMHEESDGFGELPTLVTRVLVVDDHRTFAELLARALNAEPDLSCVGHALNAKDGIAAAQRLTPDIILMDLHLPDLDGISATAELTAQNPDLKVLILTAHASPVEMTRAGAAGASGFLAKDGALDDVLAALRTARRGSLILPAAVLAEFNHPQASSGSPESTLTPRELEVLVLLGQGRDPRGIAKDLGVSLHTCRGYVKSILAKLNVHSQLEAVVVASRAGLIRLGE
jgi:DNA-binding NarL/FixJ family response regulator